MRYLHTLDPDDLKDLDELIQDDMERADELLREDMRMEQYYERKHNQ